MSDKSFMVEELKRERERSKLNLEELTNLLDGGEMFTEKRRRMSKEDIVNLKKPLHNVYLL